MQPGPVERDGNRSVVQGGNRGRGGGADRVEAGDVRAAVAGIAMPRGGVQGLHAAINGSSDSASRSRGFILSMGSRRGTRWWEVVVEGGGATYGSS